MHTVNRFSQTDLNKEAKPAELKRGQPIRRLIALSAIIFYNNGTLVLKQKYTLCVLSVKLYL